MEDVLRDNDSGSLMSLACGTPCHGEAELIPAVRRQPLQAAAMGLELAVLTG